VGLTTGGPRARFFRGFSGVGLEGVVHRGWTGPRVVWSSSTVDKEHSGSGDRHRGGDQDEGGPAWVSKDPRGPRSAPGDGPGARDGPDFRSRRTHIGPYQAAGTAALGENSRTTDQAGPGNTDQACPELAGGVAVQKTFSEEPPPPKLRDRRRGAVGPGFSGGPSMKRERAKLAWELAGPNRPTSRQPVLGRSESGPSGPALIRETPTRLLAQTGKGPKAPRWDQILGAASPAGPEPAACKGFHRRRTREDNEAPRSNKLKRRC